jgi:hypothetical protein
MANNINDSDFRVAAVSRRRTFDPDRNFTRLRLNCPVPIGVSAATAPGKSGSPVHEREKVRSRRLYRPPRHCQKRKNGASAEKVSGVAGRIRRHGTGRAVDELVASVKALGILLRTGEMRDSIEHNVGTEGLRMEVVGIVGTDNEVAKYQELGTSHITAAFISWSGGDARCAW